MDWLTYFRQNSTGRANIPWQKGIVVEPHLRKPLIRSLQRFQIGEQGDGVHLKRAAAATGDPSYNATIALFVAEEQEHARLLARVIQGMDGSLLKRHWSDTCFVFVRRMSRLKLELMVLLVVELIAKRYYRALYEGTNDPVLRAVFAQIIHDEEGHVAFHCDYLNGALGTLPSSVRFMVLMCWQLFFNAVCLVVMYDHRSVLRATGVSPLAFWCDCGLIFNEAAQHIFNRNPVLDNMAAK